MGAVEHAHQVLALVHVFAGAGQHLPDAAARRQDDDGVRALTIAGAFLGDLACEQRHLRADSRSLGLELAGAQAQLGRALIGARAVVVAVADEDALGDRIALDLRLFQTLRSGGPGRRRRDPLILGAVALDFGRDAGLAQRVGPALRVGGLRGLGDRRIELGGLRIEPRLKQLQAPVAKPFDLGGQHGQRRGRELRSGGRAGATGTRARRIGGAGRQDANDRRAGRRCAAATEARRRSSRGLVRAPIERSLRSAIGSSRPGR